MLWVIYALIALVLAALFQISIMIMSSYDKAKKNISSKLVSSLWLFVIIGAIACLGLFGMNMYGINTSITYITEYRPLLLFSAFALMTYEMLLILSMSAGGGGFSSLIAGLSYIFVIIFGVFYFSHNINWKVILGIIFTILGTIYTVIEREKLK
jgi:drug/metabolite transporter (DMT)-like permease